MSIQDKITKTIATAHLAGFSPSRELVEAIMRDFSNDGMLNEAIFNMLGTGTDYPTNSNRVTTTKYTGDDEEINNAGLIRAYGNSRHSRQTPPKTRNSASNFKTLDGARSPMQGAEGKYREFVSTKSVLVYPLKSNALKGAGGDYLLTADLHKMLGVKPAAYMLRPGKTLFMLNSTLLPKGSDKWWYSSAHVPLDPTKTPKENRDIGRKNKISGLILKITAKGRHIARAGAGEIPSRGMSAYTTYVFVPAAELEFMMEQHSSNKRILTAMERYAPHQAKSFVKTRNRYVDSFANIFTDRKAVQARKNILDFFKGNTSAMLSTGARGRHGSVVHANATQSTRPAVIITKAGVTDLKKGKVDIRVREVEFRIAFRLNSLVAHSESWTVLADKMNRTRSTRMSNPDGRFDFEFPYVIPSPFHIEYIVRMNTNGRTSIDRQIIQLPKQGSFKSVKVDGAVMNKVAPIQTNNNPEIIMLEILESIAGDLLKTKTANAAHGAVVEHIERLTLNKQQRA